MDGNYEPKKIESKWQNQWVENQTFRYEEERVESEEDVFSVDTPPPTVSGNLHMGHLYQFTLQDFVARFRRMNNKTVFFPFGYDDNGIASERLTERELGIRHQDFTRKEFQEKCREVCEEYEEDFTEKMQLLGFSMDWDQTYKTIEPRVQKISQMSFIQLYDKGREYREKAPAIWCPDCETAISQVEMEDLEEQSHFNDIEFELATGNGSIIISTTRPELLPACVAIFVHPEDEDNEHLVGESVKVPIFDYEVPILKDERVDRETGTGVVMCCTFGDQKDIEWYQAHNLDLRIAIDESGTLTEKAGKYEGMSTEEAREKIVDDLEEEGKLLDRREITHAKKVHERCDTPIEFRVTEQWYVEILDKKEEYLEAGEQIDWYPEKMFTRYKHWIEGLEWDWCISRQRDSGIPFPVWYCENCNHEIMAEESQLPVDPIQDEPPVEECPECGSNDFEPETDVFDTWATSSLTPLINAHWNGEEIEREELYPANLRPQGHDIISFWLFHTVVKCYEHTGEVPFDSVMINGMVLDKNRQKMSKSKGNVVTPTEVLENYPVDAARYWAGGTKIGDDFPFKEKDLVSGQKLMRKLWNASKLVDHLTDEQQQKEDINEEELDEIDKWMIAKTDQLIEEVSQHYEDYEFSKARDKTRNIFWNVYCDNYLEIVKQKLEDEENTSTKAALRKTHEKFLKLFAPILSHITEEIYHQMYSNNSIHLEDWPEKAEIKADLKKGEKALEVITALRKYKTKNQMAPTEEIEKVEVYGDIAEFSESIKKVMHIENLVELEEEPETENKIIEIKLNYEKAGPKYGNQVGEIEEALEQNEFSFEAGRLNVAGEHLKPEMFKVKEERSFQGSGEMIETENTVVIVK